MKPETLKALLAAREARRPIVLATNLATGEERLIDPRTADVDDALREAARNDKSGVIDTAEGKLFLHVYNPPLRMAIVGAVHIAQPLCRMAALAGYDVTVIDPREAFASEERFPGVTLLGDWPDESMAKFAPDRRSAVVTLTHDPKLDDPALAIALRSDAFYIGALGSTRTHAKRLARLKEEGFSDEQMARIHGPAGLSIGAKSPAEIAVSILGQVTERLRKST
jgi:xanthine dehydrogenase accessory factor